MTQERQAAEPQESRLPYGLTSPQVSAISYLRAQAITASKAFKEIGVTEHAAHLTDAVSRLDLEFPRIEAYYRRLLADAQKALDEERAQRS